MHLSSQHQGRRDDPILLRRKLGLSGKLTQASSPEFAPLPTQPGPDISKVLILLPFEYLSPPWGIFGPCPLASSLVSLSCLHLSCSSSKGKPEGSCQSVSLTLSFPCSKPCHGDFPGGPVAKTPHSQCRGLDSIPGQGTRFHRLQLRIPRP